MGVTDNALPGSQPSRAVQGKVAAQKQQAIGSETAELALEVPNAKNQETQTLADKDSAYRQLNDRIAQVYESLPSHTAFVVLSGHGDPRAFSALTAKKNRFDQLFKTTPLSTMAEQDKWMQADERALLSAIHRVREGMTFLAIKRQ